MKRTMPAPHKPGTPWLALLKKPQGFPLSIHGIVNIFNLREPVGSLHLILCATYAGGKFKMTFVKLIVSLDSITFHADCCSWKSLFQ